MAFNETDRYIPGDIGNACWYCGAGQRSERGVKERLFRCTRDIDQEGYVVMCEACVLDLAEMAGCLPPAKTRALKAKNTELQKQVTEATRALEAATDLIESERHYQEVVIDG